MRFLQFFSFSVKGGAATPSYMSIIGNFVTRCPARSPLASSHDYLLCHAKTQTSSLTLCLMLCVSPCRFETRLVSSRRNLLPYAAALPTLNHFLILRARTYFSGVQLVHFAAATGCRNYCWFFKRPRAELCFETVCAERRLWRSVACGGCFGFPVAFWPSSFNEVVWSGRTEFFPFMAENPSAKHHCLWSLSFLQRIF